ncbi:MAG: hypothetical protein Q4B26_19180 [Eubacteriales bacterium]|nr:hypothetical protein [Eubacteriales bacterium]
MKKVLVVILACGMLAAAAVPAFADEVELSVDEYSQDIEETGLGSEEALLGENGQETDLGSEEALLGASDQNMYRLYNPNSGEHFYTASAGERDHLDKLGWNYEGIGWVAPVSSKSPVYRMYNPNAGDHHYTISSGEKDFLVKAGWNYEGIGWYSDTRKRVPLYRAYNPNAAAGSHNYTTSKGEQNTLVKAGWKEEGISWYAVKEGKPASASDHEHQWKYEFYQKLVPAITHEEDVPAITHEEPNYELAGFYACNMCNLRFDTDDELFEHQDSTLFDEEGNVRRNSHGSWRVAYDIVCNGTKTVTDVQARKETVTDSPKHYAWFRYICTVCGERVTGKYSGAEHEHQWNEEYKTIQIAPVFEEVVMPAETRVDPIYDGVGIYRCNICFKEFDSGEAYDQHARQMLSEKGEEHDECYVYSNSVEIGNRTVLISPEWIKKTVVSEGKTITTKYVCTICGTRTLTKD